MPEARAVDRKEVWEPRSNVIRRVEAMMSPSDRAAATRRGTTQSEVGKKQQQQQRIKRGTNMHKATHSDTQASGIACVYHR